MHRYLVLFCCSVCLWACSSEPLVDSSTYVRYDADLFSVELPDNWEVITDNKNWLDAKSSDYCQIDSVRKNSLPNLTFHLDIHRTSFTNLETFSKYHINSEWGACKITFPNYSLSQQNNTFDILLGEGNSTLKVIEIDYIHHVYKEDHMKEYIALGYNNGYGVICRVGALRKEDFLQRKEIIRKILQSLLLK
ncbi:MAG: hypothetical protein MK212_10340 [Saprospiraceae bacterium]|nr:hypothetical protein [Saprospiraceae bacterium]